jgi:hypothetical protein
MGIYIGNREVKAIVALGRMVKSVYSGARLVWTMAIRSCFGAGWWINNYPWTNKDGWRNK